MEVICIKEGKWSPDDGVEYGADCGPKYGEKCTVIGERFNSYYILKEYQFSPIDGVKEAYKKKWFIPLSSIDETEMEREYKTEKV